MRTSKVSFIVAFPLIRGHHESGMHGPITVSEKIAQAELEYTKGTTTKADAEGAQTQGKTERWHQTLKNRILLEYYFLSGDLEAQMEALVDHYNHQRCHECLKSDMPADVYLGRNKAILKQKEGAKRKAPEARRLHHRQRAA